MPDDSEQETTRICAWLNRLHNRTSRPRAVVERDEEDLGPDKYVDCQLFWLALKSQWSGFDPIPQQEFEQLLDWLKDGWTRGRELVALGNASLTLFRGQNGTGDGLSLWTH